MRTPFRPLAGAALLVPALALALYGALRMGWMRHGTSPWSSEFLHLSWVFDPSAPSRRAHLMNLLVFALGVILIAAGLFIALGGQRRSTRIT